MPTKKDMFEPAVPTEESDCIAFASYLRLKGLKFSHIPNETYTKSWKVKQRNKDIGVSRGVPDYIILIERPLNANSTLLFIEMKREKGGKVSEEQAEWVNGLNKVFGVVAMVCRGFDQAKEAVDAFLA